ncbi:MAG: ribosome silencing factor [Evtepia sp.]
MTPKEMALAFAKVLDEKKGQDILVLETNTVSSLADYFVICTGSSAPQMKAMAEACERIMKEQDIVPHHIEGHRDGTWILQDYSAVIVHLFSEETRAFYGLDHLWADAAKVDISGIVESHA